MNLHQVYLYVYETIEIVLQLYTKYGFKRDGVTRDCRFIKGEYVSSVRMSLLSKEYKTLG
ncbi:GNAT family N-acetyltransferase [Paenibacillus bouchesdurhonensis]|uniref:GNAT family N-acetyltransferase n=1 Tax=Paenibacillus bouchesdurhonensis TaxID=1870990 RepID=UPI001900B6B9|nr:GNAT family protein [Paenibacillus bouchesdurhonensis]